MNEKETFENIPLVRLKWVPINSTKFQSFPFYWISPPLRKVDTPKQKS